MFTCFRKNIATDAHHSADESFIQRNLVWLMKMPSCFWMEIDYFFLHVFSWLLKSFPWTFHWHQVNGDFLAEDHENQDALELRTEAPNGCKFNFIFFGLNEERPSYFPLSTFEPQSITPEWTHTWHITYCGQRISLIKCKWHHIRDSDATASLLRCGG